MQHQNSTVTTAEKPTVDQLVTDNLPLVHHIVRRMPINSTNGVFDFEDLVSCGVFGLIDAARRFDPEHGAPFASFAALRIRGAVMDALRRADPLSRSARQRARQLNAVESALTVQNGREPSSAEVCAASGLTTEQYHQATTAAGYACVSLDAAVSSAFDDEEGRSVQIADEVDDDPGQLEHRELLKELSAAIASLPARDRQLLGLRYQQGLTLSEVADILGVSASRVSQLHARVVTRLREALEVETPKAA